MTTKEKVHEIIFEADTKAGKLFDVLLLIIILISVLVVVLESVDSLRSAYFIWFSWLEWGFTIIFTIEFLLRIWCINHPKTYILSFFGVVDIISILPSYLALFITGTTGFMIIRALRLLRVFRIFKLAQFIGESKQLLSALKASLVKISVFIGSILVLVILLGTVMYMIEGGLNGFTSIPKSIYWAIVTLTTVGYGDIAPQTTLGQVVASVIMILGYGILAVPTGIVTGEIIRQDKKTNTQSCIECGYENHDNDAKYCKKCGFKIIYLNGDSQV